MTWIRYSFTLNLKSLAAFRIGFGFLLLIDLYYRWIDASVFYTDYGVLPRIDFIEKYLHAWKFSFHLANGSLLFIYFSLAVAALFALGLLLGYRTRLCAFVSWLLMISLQVRNPTILSGADDLMRLMLFWSLFLPLGATFSVDQALNKDKSEQKDVFNLASIAFIMQLLFMYFFSALLKNHPIWYTEGSAILYALQLDIFVTPLGSYLKSFPELLKIMTFSTVYLELLGPLLFLLPIKNPLFRIGIPLSFIFFHFGLFLTLYLGAFPWMAILSWIALLPKEFWNFFKYKKPIYFEIYYDPGCPFCYRICHLLCELLRLPSSSIHSAEINPKIYSLIQKENSWCIKVDKRVLMKYEGILFLVSQSPIFKFLLPLLSSKPFTYIGAKSYKFVSTHRPLVGQILKFSHPEKPKFELSKIKQALIVFLLFLVTAWNVNSLNSEDDDKMLPEPFNNIGLFFHLNQQWNMFAPYPFRDDGWYVVEATLFNGRQVDPLQGGNPTNFTKPNFPALTVSSSFWRKYLLNLRNNNYSGHWLLFGKYLCRMWNDHHFNDERINTYEIFYMSEKTPGPQQPEPIPNKQFMWRHYCFDKPENWNDQ